MVGVGVGVLWCSAVASIPPLLLLLLLLLLGLGVVVVLCWHQAAVCWILGTLQRPTFPSFPPAPHPWVPGALQPFCPSFASLWCGLGSW